MAVMSVGRYTIPELDIDRSAGEMTNHAKPLRSERRRRSSVAALAVALCLGLTACGVGDTGGAGASAGSAMPSGAPSSPSASPSPTSTLSPEEQEAFKQASQTALAFTQTIMDLYTGARTDVNDMYLVATGDFRERVMGNIARGLADGTRTIPAGFQVRLASAEPLKVQLDRKQPRVVVRACVDWIGSTDIKADGTKDPGGRGERDFWVIKVDHLPEPGWAVSRMMVQEDPADREC